MKCLKQRFAWASALALAMTVTSQVTTVGQTNGVIMIVTRYEQDLSWYGEDGDICDGMKVTGGGQISQGDAQMAELLGDYGYPTRVIIDMELQQPGSPYAKVNPVTTFAPDPAAYLAGGGGGSSINTDYKACLIIQSGSANSSHAPLLATNGVPYMAGEHCVLGSRANKPGSIFMYSGTDSDDIAGQTLSTNQWMKVTAAGKLHPIMQGIPLDANDCVKIYRDPYPEEFSHMPLGGNPLWQWDIPIVPVAEAAPATTVLGLFASDQTKSIFAVVNVTNGVGGLLANGQAATVRLVHFYVCDGGQDSYRRVFNSLSDIGRVIFVRAAKWAMGETLQPYKSLKIKDVSVVGSQKIKLAWDASADKSYKILGTANLLGPADFSNWQTIVQDIAGTNGLVSRTLDISAAPQVAFLRLQQVP